MSFWENIKIALLSIRTNFLRSLLTMLIIVVGITCLVGILTAIDAILFSMSDSFNSIGANSFSIQRSRQNIQSNKKGRKVKVSEALVYKQATDFKDAFSYSSSKVSVNTRCSSSATIKYGEKETNPTVNLYGIDENFLDASSLELELGRTFSKTEVETGSPKTILGHEIVKKLFDDKPEKAIGKIVQINTNRYKVIGIIKSKGTAMSGNTDNRVYIPLVKAKQLYGYAKRNYGITVAMENTIEIENAIAQATGTMRNVRKLTAAEDNDFEIRKSDGILKKLTDITTEIRLGTIAIALMTLLGAAIGLMNIMLVSVTERTREIGVRKALGATRNNILIQFLTEAVVICQIGGIGGIILGILAGNMVSIMTKSSFIIPWPWISLGIIVCIFVGVLSGLYPALRASRLDPIESLRYE